MGRTMVVRYTTRAESADENQRLVENVFAQLAEEKPDGVHYATFRLGDGVTFVHVAHYDGDDNPLQDLKAFGEFQQGVGARVVAPPNSSPATIVGSYRFIAD